MATVGVKGLSLWGHYSLSLLAILPLLRNVVLGAWLSLKTKLWSLVLEGKILVNIPAITDNWNFLCLMGILWFLKCCKFSKKNEPETKISKIASDVDIPRLPRMDRSVDTEYRWCCTVNSVHPQTIRVFARGIDDEAFDTSTACLCCSQSSVPQWPSSTFNTLLTLPCRTLWGVSDLWSSPPLSTSAAHRVIHSQYCWCIPVMLS